MAISCFDANLGVALLGLHIGFFDFQINLMHNLELLEMLLSFTT